MSMSIYGKESKGMGTRLRRRIAEENWIPTPGASLIAGPSLKESLGEVSITSQTGSQGQDFDRGSEEA